MISNQIDFCLTKNWNSGNSCAWTSSFQRKNNNCQFCSKNSKTFFELTECCQEALVWHLFLQYSHDSWFFWNSDSDSCVIKQHLRVSLCCTTFVTVWFVCFSPAYLFSYLLFLNIWLKFCFVCFYQISNWHKCCRDYPLPMEGTRFECHMQ